MGEVYLVEHPRLPRRDALKILRSEISADTGFRARFIREAASIAALEHPHIVTVYDRGEEDGQVWIATQYVDGADASVQLSADRYPHGIPVDEAIEITAAIADALDHAHDRGLIHRDVKPANILLALPDRDGRRRIYLADFGIARPVGEAAGMTSTNFVLGTFAYSAPEQLMGTTIDGRADQYALAATAYHLLTGRPVFPEANQVAVISQVLTRPAPAPSTVRPELTGLDAAFASALSKDPQARFPRCRDFAAALAAAAIRSGIGYPSAAPTQQAPASAPLPIQRESPPSTDPRPTRTWPTVGAARRPPEDTANSSRLFDLQEFRRDLSTARARLEKAAAGGDIGSMNSLGVLLYSQWEPPDMPAARNWLEAAAKAGHTAAMFNLGCLMQQWDPPDLPAACFWYERASAGGHVDAMFNLGCMLESPDEDRAADWWQKAAKAGHTDAMMKMAGVLLAFDPPDVEGAQGWWEEASAAGSLDAMLCLGESFESDWDPPLWDDARYWYEKAADAGHPEAMHSLALLAHRRDPKDRTTVRSWYEKAAAAGHVRAMIMLGHEVRSSDAAATHAWWQKAAEQGDTIAMRLLGVLLTEGDDLRGAHHWLEKAANAGDLDAMLELGKWLDDWAKGWIGNDRDILDLEEGEEYWEPPDRAQDWYQKAAKVVRSSWPEVREAVLQQNRVTDVLLELATVETVKDYTLILTHPSSPLAERLNRDPYNDQIRKALEEVLEVIWGVRCEVADPRPSETAIKGETR